MLLGGVVVPGSVVLGGFVPGVVSEGGFVGVVSGVVGAGVVSGVGLVGVVSGAVPGAAVPGVVLGFDGVVSGVVVPGLLGVAVPGCGAAVPGVGAAVPGCVVPEVEPGVVWPCVPVCPDIEPDVCPLAVPAAVPELPVAPAPDPVCHAAEAYITPPWRSCALGPGVEEGDCVGDALHWSATLLALVTLNSRVAEAVPLFAPAPEFIPELLPAEAVPVDVEALAEAPPGSVVLAPALVAVPSCPVTWTSFPISVRTASRFPLSL